MDLVEWIEQVDAEALDEWFQNVNLIRKLKRKVKQAAPSQEVVENFEQRIKCGIDEALRDCRDVWGRLFRFGSVSVEAQQDMGKRQLDMLNRHELLIVMYKEMLTHKKWLVFEDLIHSCVNRILLYVIDRYLLSKRTDTQTIVRLKVKRLLSDSAFGVWEKMLGDMEELELPPTIKFPLDLYIPTLRRLGMLDILEANWSMYGHWCDILDHIEPSGRTTFKRNEADKILDERSEIWWSSRSSQGCRSLWLREGRGHGGYGGHVNLTGPPPPQCFRYFPKCSAEECSNIETAKDPHRIRCEKCWYFHCCSYGCKEYSEMFGMHNCSFTPRDKVAQIKAETEAYLGTGSNSFSVWDERCNFCSTKEENLSAKLLMCSRCKKVCYCSEDCQNWDWALKGHKENCKKSK